MTKELEFKEFKPRKTKYDDLVASRVSSLRKSATESELRFQSLLDALNVEYIFQYPCNIGIECIFDFWLPSNRICIEIDGGYHMTEDMLKSDRNRDRLCARRGILVMRFLNDETICFTETAIRDFCNVLGIEPTKKALDMSVSTKEWLERTSGFKYNKLK